MHEAGNKEIEQCYQAYKKCPEKSQKKLKRLEEFADANDLNYLLAQYYLGDIYAQGLGVEQDNDKAIQYFYDGAWNKDKDAFDRLKEFADKPVCNPRAQYYIGTLYQAAHSVAENINEALHYFYYAAWNEYKDKDAFDRLKEFADKPVCNPRAQYYLGKLYHIGRSVKKNILTAIKYFYDAAWNKDKAALDKLHIYADEDKHPKALQFLSSIYYNGRGVDKDLEKAARYGIDAARALESSREVLLKRTQLDENYEEVIKKKECAYLKNQEGSLEASLGRVAFFRGIHYVKKLFDTNAINTHRELNDTDVFLVSSAAYTLTGKKFLADIPSDPEHKAGEMICKILKKFKAESENLYNKFHETYTNNHDKFHDCLGNPSLGKDELTQKAFRQYRWIFQNFAEKLYPKTWEEAVKRNPFVSFACNATHGIKYSVGEKSFTGGAGVILSPEYDNNGKPKNKYLGKVYTAILSPKDIWELNPTFVIDKHAKHKLEISTHYSNNILTENEVSFFGYVPQGIVKASQVITIDDLGKNEKKNYKKENNNFRKKPGKLQLLIEKKSKEYEKNATELIQQSNSLRIYPDIFESYFTHLPNNSEMMKAVEWLHSINAGNPVVASSPIPGEKAATKNSVYLLTTNLTRQPFNLEENWASILTNVSMSFCVLGGTGAFFAQILNNPKISLETLSLVNCQLTENDTKCIAHSLSGNTYLRKLTLDKNVVKDTGAKFFANALKKNKTLQELSLFDTDIKNIACFAALFPKGGEAKALNKTLRVLKVNFDLNGQHLKTIQKGLTRNLQ